MGQSGAEGVDSIEASAPAAANQDRNRERQSDERRRRRRKPAPSRDRRRARSTRDNLRRDPTGLHRIHWAALNNRCDLIERLCAEDPSLLTKRCQNNLFADGTPLHLAAMNGSLEAARLILALGLRAKSVSNQEATVSIAATTTQGTSADTDDATLDVGALGEFLEARDLEGQTPLMRTATPRSKKWNTIRDLLKKNFWSLSGRAAEVALLLIAAGADWTKTEPLNGMNLMHLAILNDYDDIVSLLLVLDRRLINVSTLKVASAADHEQHRGAEETQQLVAQKSSVPKSEPITDMPDSSSDSSTTASRVPLIDSARENAEHLVARGLKPLELAILYSRVKIIGLLWRPRRAKQTSPTAGAESRDHVDSGDQAEFKHLLVRACFSDSEETAKFVKPLLLKLLLGLDLAFVALVWAPAYCLSPTIESDGQGRERLVSLRPSLKGGLFFASYCLAMALTLRVMLKNPGFLRRHSVHYLSELAGLLSLAPKARGMISGRLNESSDNPDGRDKSSATSSGPPIRLDEKASILVDGAGAKSTAAKSPVRAQDQDEHESGTKITTLALKTGPGGASASKQLKQSELVSRLLDLQRGVRYLCHRCQCIRRPRSRHCNLCDHCVQDFDHHCIYLGCCIGRYNRLDFLLALIVLSITSLYGAILQTLSIHHVHEHNPSLSGWSHLWHFVSFVWISKYAVIGGIKAFCHLRRACLGVTLHEEARSKRLRMKFGRRGPSDEISRTYASLSALDEGEHTFWRYLPYRGDQLELRRRQWAKNLREFANQISPDEYLLTLVGTDTPLARSLLNRWADLRIKR